MGVVHNLRTFAAIALGLATLGCATTGQLLPLDYAYGDHPEQKRIEVRYRNNTTQGLCVLAEHWPNQGGKIDQNGDTVFLVIDGRRFPLRPFNTGYCAGGCSTYVAPGKEIAGFIAYSDFDLPADLEASGKHLELAAYGFSCPRPRDR